ncbi:MAG: epsE [Firmicutes bacterium]|nr:epsE [Bacillota bacterium]
MALHKRLEDLLLEIGLITGEQLNEALIVQRKTGELLGKVLINLGYINEQDMVETIAFQLGLPRIDLAASIISQEAVHLIPLSLAERYQVLPTAVNGSKLTLAMADPTNFYAIDDVRMATGLDVNPVIAAETEINWAINQAYGVKEVIAKAVQKLQSDDADETAEKQIFEDAPIVNVVDSLISQAVKERASDIHIEPLEKVTRVRFRIDGVLEEVVTFPRNIHLAIISRIKIMSEMDISEKRKPQDGRFQVKENGHEIDIRVATLPTILGEKIVMRILDKKAIAFDIKELGFTKDNLQRYSRLYKQPHGLILVTGPTGSGKTTTLYSTLMQVNSPAKNMITIEEPIEYRLDGVNQVQVNGKVGLTFANGLRSILRQDPNVIMVGEIRDKETADIAVRSALTGHMVFSTLHTNDAVGAIIRLLDMGIEPFLAASALLGVVAQRLARKLCLDCREAYAIEARSLDGQFLSLQGEQSVEAYRAMGCPYCNYTGYHGRIAIQEVLVITPAIRDAVNRRLPEHAVSKLAMKEGMQTMLQDGIAKILAGDTSIEEIMRVAYQES